MLRRKKAAGKDSIAKKKSTGTIDKEAEAQLLTNPMPFEKDCFFPVKEISTLSDFESTNSLQANPNFYPGILRFFVHNSYVIDCESYWLAKRQLCTFSLKETKRERGQDEDGNDG